jgi:hypothetical protein
LARLSGLGTMTLANFRTRYPEFRTASDAFVQAYLDDAAKMVSTYALGDAYDVGHGLACAHLIAISPAGKNARMTNDDGSTQYGNTLKNLALERVAGISLT